MLKQMIGAGLRRPAAALSPLAASCRNAAWPSAARRLPWGPAPRSLSGAGRLTRFRGFRAGFVVALCVSLTCALGAQTAAAVPEVYLFKYPKPAPAMAVTTLNGKRVSLASLRGKVVLLNFWATWCGPCREEIPALEQIQRQYAGKVQVVGMSVDEIPPAAVAAKAASLGINYPVAIASPALQARFGGMSTIPDTWVIDQRGEVQQKNHGAQTFLVFDTQVRALLGMPTAVKVARVDQLSPDGKVGTVDIPGIAAEMKALSPTQRQRVLAGLNETACSCGCEWSLATCRVKDPACGYSLPLAKGLIAKLAGKP